MRSLALADLGQGALRLDGLGGYHREIASSSPEAQAFFDQGLRLLFAFNHDEAARSFARAAELDPQCAVCFWGISFALGPNYNMVLLPDRAQAAWEAAQKAQLLREKARPAEQALIDALQKRYKGPEPLDPPAQQPYNEAFAAAMRDAAGRFPDDPDLQTFLAESLMDVNPWKLWTNDGKPAPGTEEIVSVLEKVLAQIAAQVPPDLPAGYNTARDILGLAARLLEGDIAWKRGRADAALMAFEDAVQREDNLNYDEPSDWFYPARHHLGAALLAAGRPADAEAVFRADLERNPANGWALFGLQQALTAQKKDPGAVKAELDKAWAKADVQLTGAVF